jgi:DNA-binding transcriptional LysR family regulator
LAGRRLFDVEFGVYATPQMLREINTERPFEARWIGFVNSILQTPIGVWFSAAVNVNNVCLRCDSFVAVRAAAEASIGVALLPRILGDSSPLLAEIKADTAELTIGLWALAHPDLARSARVHAFIEHLARALASPESA